MFGQQRLIEALTRVKEHPSKEVVHYLKVILEQFSDQTGWQDDITMLAVKFVSGI